MRDFWIQWLVPGPSVLSEALGKRRTSLELQQIVDAAGAATVPNLAAIQPVEKEVVAFLQQASVLGMQLVHAHTHVNANHHWYSTN